ncbi:rhomboid family intramembrane serine protease [Salarchaeum sp. JOR-1]|uniref:rhomboid family intramembrane serine protease n=1 Tax=Salarchaeum sp. JOR-1 TaxID=2599399 RepID=UPI001198BB6B|nr:rhomboid family intramembrane serine protease [Salarchaeum sp. JOR-1]QDX39714.1 rhomboid family intramembrane serine protease [Salarchaeum sp. JOR-1]
MARCDRCGEEEGMPYQCRLCGGTFCSEHRLPENHDCPGLEGWNDPNGVFDSGFDDSVSSSSSKSSVLGLDTGPGGVLAYFRGNATYILLGLMWLMFLVQYAVAPYVLGIEQGTRAWLDLFTLNTSHPLYVWTWVTSVFAHGGLTHIVFNSIVLYFFGPVVERRIGSKKFVALFLVSGALAGLAQVGAALAVSAPAAVLGASGAIAALMGVLTVLNPNLRILLYFVIPMPLWVATLLFAGYSVLMSGVGGIGAGGVAQLAHLAGLALGLLYGVKLKRDGERAPQELRFGGGGGGGLGGRRRR